MLFSSCLLALSYVSVQPAPSVDSPPVAAVPPTVRAASEQLNLMVRCVKAQDWEGTIRAADAVMTALRQTPTGRLYATGQQYATACFAKVAALYKLERYAEVKQTGDELLYSGMLVPGTLPERAAQQYERQTLFFVADACLRLGGGEPALYDRALECVELYESRNASDDSSTDSLSPIMCHRAVEALVKRSAQADPLTRRADLARAQQYAARLAESWPQHDLIPVVQQLIADASKEQHP